MQCLKIANIFNFHFSFLFLIPPPPPLMGHFCISPVLPAICGFYGKCEESVSKVELPTLGLLSANNIVKLLDNVAFHPNTSAHLRRACTNTY